MGCSNIDKNGAISEAEAESDNITPSSNIETEDNNLIIQDNIVVFPEPNGLTEVQIDTLGNELPDSKDDGDLPVMLTFNAGGATKIGRASCRERVCIYWLRGHSKK